jgi:hypothetical protein
VSVHSERCDCCGRKLQRVPSELYPGEELIGGHSIGVGRYCVPCWASIDRMAQPGEARDEVVPCPTHHPAFWPAYRAEQLAQYEIERSRSTT